MMETINSHTIASPSSTGTPTIENRTKPPFVEGLCSAANSPIDSGVPVKSDKISKIIGEPYQEKNININLKVDYLYYRGSCCVNEGYDGPTVKYIKVLANDDTNEPCIAKIYQLLEEKLKNFHKQCPFKNANESKLYDVAQTKHCQLMLAPELFQRQNSTILNNILKGLFLDIGLQNHCEIPSHLNILIVKTFEKIFNLIIKERKLCCDENLLQWIKDVLPEDYEKHLTINKENYETRQSREIEMKQRVAFQEDLKQLKTDAECRWWRAQNQNEDELRDLARCEKSLTETIPKLHNLEQSVEHAKAVRADTEFGLTQANAEKDRVHERYKEDKDKYDLVKLRAFSEADNLAHIAKRRNADAIAEEGKADIELKEAKNTLSNLEEQIKHLQFKRKNTLTELAEATKNYEAAQKRYQREYKSEDDVFAFPHRLSRDRLKDEFL